MTIRERDHGADALVRKSDTPLRVKFGLIGSDASQPANDAPGLTVARIGEIHEFGLGNNPRRSWLRDWFDGNIAEAKRRIRSLMKKVLDDEMTFRRMGDRLGLWAVGEIQDRMASQIGPELNEDYARRMGKSTADTLIVTGQLRSSVTHETEVN